MKNLLFTILYCIVFIISCTREEILPENEDLIFVNSYRIKIPSYTFQDAEGKEYTVRGDTSFHSAFPDTVNSMPVLKWDSMGIRVITAAIFNSIILVEGDQIVNTEDIVWQWHSGSMMDGEEGFVKYSDGRLVIHDSIDYENTTDSLDEGLYYWAIWGWGESGIRIWYSSRELKFYVLK
jgi:hypothetical protein